MDIDKLKDIISEERMTKEELALSLGISVRTLNAKLNNRTRMTVRDADKLTKILKIQNPSAIFFTHKS